MNNQPQSMNNQPQNVNRNVSPPPPRLTSEQIIYQKVQELSKKVDRLESVLSNVRIMARESRSGNVFFWGNQEKFGRKEYEWYVAQHYWNGLSRFPNLKNPRRLGEKLLWLKLHYMHPLMDVITDKYRVKDYISEKIGQDYIIPLLGVWNNVWDIDFESLPPQFVLKNNNWAGGRWGIHIVKDKSRINRDVVLWDMLDWMQDWKDGFYFAAIEARRRPVVFAEKYMEEERDGDGLKDYKFLCFHGEPKLFWVDKDRSTGHKRNFYDMDGNLLPVKLTYPNFVDEGLPERYDEMLTLARKLSAPFLHMRVDFYEVNGRVYFGEFTPHTDAGLLNFTPDEWDYKLGEYLNLGLCEPEFLVDYPAAYNPPPYRGDTPQ